MYSYMHLCNYNNTYRHAATAAHLLYIFYIFRIPQCILTITQAMKSLVLMQRLCVYQSMTLTDLIYGSNLKLVEYRQIQIVVQNANNWSTKAA